MWTREHMRGNNELDVQVSGYAIQDKIAIAMNHLLPKGREEMGLTAENRFHSLDICIWG